MQLMDLSSWLNHEDARAEEVRKVMTKEEKEPFYIKAELVSPKAIIKDHNLISPDVSLETKYITTQEQAFLHFEDTFIIFGT